MKQNFAYTIAAILGCITILLAPAVIDGQDTVCSPAGGVCGLLFLHLGHTCCAPSVCNELGYCSATCAATGADCTSFVPCCNNHDLCIGAGVCVSRLSA